MSAATEGRALRLVCPDWCTLPEQAHQVEHNEPGDIDHALVYVYAQHAGAKIGPFEPVADLSLLGGPIERPGVIISELQTETEDPAYLRQLAADALSAAKWLEAQR
ncbi:hypothetical protein JCM18899A_19130 [Nocardioides sp. AN3]